MKKTLLTSALLFTVFLTFAQTQYTAPTYFQFNTNYGYMQIGPMNTGYCHMYTDRPNFLFNKIVTSMTGEFGSYYTSDLIFKTGTTYLTNGTTRMTIQNSTGDITCYGHLLIPSSYTLKLGNRGVSTAGYFTINANPIFYNTYADIGQGSLYFRSAIGAINNGAILGIQSNKTVTINYWETYDNTVTDTKGNALAVNGGIWSHSLYVDGTIKAQEVDVQPNVWADDVFAKGYKLMSLIELEKYINAHQHLPCVPTEAEVKEHGVNVGDMNALLLRKVEELTKYVIEQNETIQTLKSKVEILESK